MLAQDPSSGRVLVKEAPDDLAAGRGGLEPGDELLEVDGHDVRDLSRKQLIELLRGEVGSTVTLTVARGERIERLTVVRGPFRKR